MLGGWGGDKTDEGSDWVTCRATNGEDICVSGRDAQWVALFCEVHLTNIH